MAITLPDIPEHERIPLVLTLLDLSTQQQERIAQEQPKARPRPPWRDFCAPARPTQLSQRY